MKTRYFRILSASPTNLRSPIVTVEVVISPGIPRHTVVGLPQGAVREALDRIRAAVGVAGYRFPRGAITINLAPADTRKNGSAFDLPIAIGILAADGQLNTDAFDGQRWLVMGELMLDGGIRPVQGVMAALMNGMSRNVDHALIPEGNVPEAEAFEELMLSPANTLEKAIRSFEGKRVPRPAMGGTSVTDRWTGPDFKDVVGHRQTIRALAIAVAGRHNVLMSGPPGCGKTMMARCMDGIQPTWSREEALKSTCLHSLRRPGTALLPRRPFRSPHHSVSAAGLLGGGTPPLPGEVSLAHGGILFLDELTQFQPRVLDGLREPVQEGVVTLSRAGGFERYPSSFQLVAAMNPCPCGFAQDRDGSCRCSARRIQSYRSRISGPLLDRIDMHLSVEMVDPLKDQGNNDVTSAELRRRIRSARHRLTNERPAFCEEIRSVLMRTLSAQRLSLRTGRSIERISQTIAAFEGEGHVSRHHLSEAIRLGNQGLRDPVS